MGARFTLKTFVAVALLSAAAEWLPRLLYALVALFILANIALMVLSIAGQYAEVLK